MFLQYYRVNISQLVRFSRCCTSVLDSHSKHLQITFQILTRVTNITSFEKYLESSSGHTLTFCLNLVKYRISGIFRDGKIWRKWCQEGVFNFHWDLFSLFEVFSMENYHRVYFSLCLFLAISGRSRTQRKLHPREKFPIYGIVLRICVGRNHSPGLLRWSSLQIKEVQMRSEFRLAGLGNSQTPSMSKA